MSIEHVAAPGSRIERTQSAAAQESPVITEAPGETGTAAPGFVVGVRPETPALATWTMKILSASNPAELLLPQDPRRRVAYLLAVDNDVYVCTSREEAQASAGGASGVIGFYLPKGVVVPAGGRAACWAAATTTASQSRISVQVCRDEE